MAVAPTRVEVEGGLLAIEPVEEFPGRVSDPDERPPVGRLEVASVGVDTQGQGRFVGAHLGGGHEHGCGEDGGPRDPGRQCPAHDAVARMEGHAGERGLRAGR